MVDHNSSRQVTAMAFCAAAALLLVGGAQQTAGGAPTVAAAATANESSASTAPSDEIAEPVDIGEGRALYLECAGAGSPTIVLESGDQAGVDQMGASVRHVGSGDAHLCL